MPRGYKVQKDDLRFEKENVGAVLSTTDERRGTIPNDLRFTKRLFSSFCVNTFKHHHRQSRVIRPRIDQALAGSRDTIPQQT